MNHINATHCPHCRAAEGETHMFGCPLLPQVPEGERDCMNCLHATTPTKAMPCRRCSGWDRWEAREAVALPLDTQRAAEEAMYQGSLEAAAEAFLPEAVDAVAEPDQEPKVTVGGAYKGALSTQVAGSHYKEAVIQPVEYIHANGIGFMEGSAIKYLTRHKKKGGAADVRKALHFCQLILELEYGETV